MPGARGCPSGLHPGPDFDPYAAAALTGGAIGQARRVLDVLAAAHLIQPGVQGRYGMHDLLRAYSRELAAAHHGQEARRAALTCLFDYYVGTAAMAADTLFPSELRARPAMSAPGGPVPVLRDPAAARRWLDAERTTLTAIAAYTAGNGWPSHTSRLAAAVTDYVETNDHYPEALTIQGHAARAARQTGDRSAEAAALTSLGRVSSAQGRCTYAAIKLGEAQRLYQQADDQAGQARVMNNMGLIDLKQGRYSDASGRFQESLTLFRQAGNPLGEAIVLGNLGVIAGRRGHHQEAIGYQEQAIAIFREHGDLQGEATALYRLGAAEVRGGRDEKAAEALGRSLILCREIGDRNGEAGALTWLGIIAGRQDRCQHAAGLLRQAMTICRDIGDQYGETMALNRLGDTLRAAGEPGESRNCHAAALDLAAATGGTPGEPSTTGGRPSRSIPLSRPPKRIACASCSSPPADRAIFRTG